MKLRTQFIVTFLLLAVVPLAAIVLFSYRSSRDAFFEAVEQDARVMADDLEQRIGSERNALAERLEVFGELPMAEMATEGVDAFLAQVIEGLGDVAPLLDSLEFVPMAPSAPRGPSPVVAGEPAVPAPEAAPAPPVEPVESYVYVHPEEVAEIASSSAEGSIDASFEIATAFVAYFGNEEDLEELREAKEMALEKLGAHREELENKQAEAWARKADERAARHETLTAEQKARIEEERRRMKLLLGGEFTVPVLREGRVVGEVRPHIRSEEFLLGVLQATGTERGEVPFAVDADGSLYVTEKAPNLEPRMTALAAGLGSGHGTGMEFDEDWVIVARREADTGLVLGIARPVRDSLDAIRRISARNFGIGLALVGLALLGVLPLSNRLTKDLQTLNRIARRLADGDLDARVDIRSRSEIGELAETFNRMASDLDANQQRLVYQEVQQRLLETEHDRKSKELEDARRFQLSLLPKSVPDHPRLDVAVLTHTAAEVGGDYYDFRIDDGELTAAIGDATGHGARAGTMVAVIKSLLTAQMAVDDLPGFLADASRTIYKMDLGRMNMALALVRTDGVNLTVAAAGMPPLLIHREGAGVEEISVEGLPLGAMSRATYRSRELPLTSGDTILLMTDGLPELLGANGDPLGYDRVQSIFAENAHLPPDALVQHLRDAADEWTGETRPADDVTFVVLRVK